MSQGAKSGHDPDHLLSFHNGRWLLYREPSEVNIPLHNSSDHNVESSLERILGLLLCPSNYLSLITKPEG